MPKFYQNAVIFIFDTNAFSYTVDRTDFDHFLRKLEKQNKTVFPFFSLINYYEYLKGIKNDTTLTERQSYIRAIKKITLGGSIFLNPFSHVQYFSNQITKEQAKKEADFFIRMINLFLSLKSYGDYEHRFKRLLRNVNSGIDKIVTGYKGMRDSAIQLKREYSKRKLKEVFKNRFDKSPSKEDYDILVRNMALRFKLNIDFDNEDIMEILAEFVSIRCFVDVYWKYVGQLVFNNRNPKWGDYFDLEQMVYLNIADYLVTNEKRVRIWVNENHNPELRGRAISSDEFYDLLDSLIIEKKAKEPVNLEWLSL